MGPKYRYGISRSAKKKKPPGRHGKKHDSGTDESIVDFSNTSTPTTTEENENVSSCSKKLKVDEEFIKGKQSNLIEENLDNLAWCYLLFDIRVIRNMVDIIGRCPSCFEKISVFHNIDKKRGLAHFLELTCSNINCDWKTSFCTSNEVKPISTNSNSTSDQVTTSVGRNPYDINLRSVIATREVGRGHTALQTFCGFMNIPPPMTEKTFLETQSKVGSVYINVAESDMKSAAEEIKEIESRTEVNADIHNTIISTDGTWQRRGFSSRNGVVSIISNSTGNCIDYRVNTSKKHLIMALCVTY